MIRSARRLVTVSLPAALLAVALGAGSALAGTYLVFVPQPLHVGGPAGEVYSVQGFGAHDGLAGAALADASLAELRRAIAGVDSLKVEIVGTTAKVTVADADKSQPDVVDRALGAAFHTLKLAGITDISVDGKRVSAASFSRGAILPVFPLAAALPPQKVAYGYVLVGDTPTPASDFYARLGAGDKAIRDAAMATLADGAEPVKLQLLEGIYSLRLKDRHAALVPRLKDGSLAVRLKTLSLLQDAGDAKVLKALEGVVSEDPSPQAKSAAAKILVAAGKTQFQKYLLLEKLRSADAAEVVDAADKLIATDDAKMGPAFASLATHTNPEVRQAGVRGLQHYKQFDQMETLLGTKGVNNDVKEPLADFLTKTAKGTRQAAGISWLLFNGSGPFAAAAAGIAGDSRVAGTTDALGAALKRSEPDVRAAAAGALGKLKDTAGLEALAAAVRGTSSADEGQVFTDAAIAIIAVQPLDQVIRISKSPDVTVRELAVKSLAEFAKGDRKPSPRVLSELRKALGDSEQNIRRAAAFALARIKDPGVIAEMVKLKGDADAQVRAQVAYSLSHGDHPEADAVLIGFLDDGDNAVKLQAVKGLRQRKVLGALDKLKQLVSYRRTDIRVEVVGAVLELAPKGDLANFDLWAEKLYDAEPKVRLLAIDGLSQYPQDRRTASAIGGAVVDSDETVKLHAIATLAASPDENAVEQVIRGLFDESKAIKLAALDALEKLGSMKAIKALQEFVLNEGDAEVKARANAVLDVL